MQSIQHKDLKRMPYKEALAFQLLHFDFLKNIKIKNRISNEKNTTPNFFFFVEHPHVYTLGRNGNEANILLNNAQRQEKNIQFFHTNRGGDITYHGPGQIVGYPILDLDNFGTDIHKYMRNLEEVLIKTLAEYGLKGERSSGETGVWLEIGTSKARKICAMGVHTSRWVTMHGFALNVNTDISFYNGIIPCGITDKGVTSLAEELGKDIDENEVKKIILTYFSEIFKTEFIDYKVLNS